MHLMRVRLDSLVLGEGQILAQVKQVHKLGQQYNGIKLVLNRLFKQAITAESVFAQKLALVLAQFPSAQLL